MLKTTVEHLIRQVLHVIFSLIPIFFQVAKEGQNVVTSPTRGRTEEAGVGGRLAEAAGGGRRVQTLQTLKALMADFARRTPTGNKPGPDF